MSASPAAPVIAAVGRRFFTPSYPAPWGDELDHLDEESPATMVLTVSDPLQLERYAICVSAETTIAELMGRVSERTSIPVANILLQQAWQTYNVHERRYGGNLHGLTMREAGFNWRTVLMIRDARRIALVVQASPTRRMHISAPQSMRVGRLEQLIAQRVRVAPQRFRLRHRSHFLHHGLRLSEYNIQEGDVLEFQPRLLGGAEDDDLDDVDDDDYDADSQATTLVGSPAPFFPFIGPYRQENTANAEDRLRVMTLNAQDFHWQFHGPPTEEQWQEEEAQMPMDEHNWVDDWVAGFDAEVAEWTAAGDVAEPPHSPVDEPATSVMVIAPAADAQVGECIVCYDDTSTTLQCCRQYLCTVCKDITQVQIRCPNCRKRYHRVSTDPDSDADDGAFLAGIIGAVAFVGPIELSLEELEAAQAMEDAEEEALEAAEALAAALLPPPPPPRTYRTADGTVFVPVWGRPNAWEQALIDPTMTALEHHIFKGRLNGRSEAEIAESWEHDLAQWLEHLAWSSTAQRGQSPMQVDTQPSTPLHPGLMPASAGGSSSSAQPSLEPPPAPKRRRVDEPLLEEGDIQIFIRGAGDRSLVVSVSAGTTVAQLQVIIAQQMGWFFSRPSDMTLRFCGFIMSGDWTLRDHNVTHGSTITLHFRLRGGVVEEHFIGQRRTNGGRENQFHRNWWNW
jgi:hypothetical protein